MIYSDAHPEMGITILIESSPGLVDIVKDHLKIINFPNTGKLTINRSGIYVE